MALRLSSPAMCHSKPNDCSVGGSVQNSPAAVALTAAVAASRALAAAAVLAASARHDAPKGSSAASRHAAAHRAARLIVTVPLPPPVRRRLYNEGRPNKAADGRYHPERGRRTWQAVGQARM